MTSKWMVLLVIVLAPEVAWAASSGINGRIVFGGEQGGVYVIEPNGSGMTRLTTMPAESPSWSPDGKRVVFASEFIGPRSLYVMNADGTGLARLTWPLTNELDQDPAWSPDGHTIAFTHRTAWLQLQIHTMNVDESNHVNVSNNTFSDQDPSWSPDGTRIAFSSSRNGHAQIYVMNADGSGQKRLTSDQDIDLHPDWSPDGGSIVFERSTYLDDAQIHVIDAVYGGVDTRLTWNAATDRYPTWSPDGTKIAFSSNRNPPGSWDVFVMNADGSGQTSVTNTAGIDIEPSWGPVAARATPGDTVVLPNDVPWGSAPTSLHIEPLYSNAGGSQSWILNAVRVPIASGVALIRPMAGDVNVGFVAPQLPRGTYRVWYDASPVTGAPGQSMVLEVVPAFRVVAAPPGYPQRFSYPGTTPVVVIGLVGPSTGPVLASSGTPTPIAPVAMTLQNIEPGAPLHADLALQQSPQQTSGPDGRASWSIRPQFVGAASFQVSAAGFQPVTLSVTVKDPTAFDFSVDFIFADTSGHARIEPIGPSDVIKLDTRTFDLHARFSIDRSKMQMDNIPDLGPLVPLTRTILGDLAGVGYRIRQVGGGIGSFVAKSITHPDPTLGSLTVPVTLRYTPVEFVGSTIIELAPSDVRLTLTTGFVRSPKGVFFDTGQPVAFGDSTCATGSCGSLALVGAGQFVGGLLNGLDYIIRIVAKIGPDGQLIFP